MSEDWSSQAFLAANNSTCDTKDNCNPMSQFGLIDYATLYKTIENLSSSTSELDILLTNFFKSVFFFTS